jgi:hypothetical protein
MDNRTFHVKLNGAGDFLIKAARLEVHDEHLVFLDSRGHLAGLFLLQDVESWSELLVDVPRKVDDEAG